MLAEKKSEFRRNFGKIFQLLFGHIHLPRVHLVVVASSGVSSKAFVLTHSNIKQLSDNDDDGKWPRRTEGCTTGSAASGKFGNGRDAFLVGSFSLILN